MRENCPWCGSPSVHRTPEGAVVCRTCYAEILHPRKPMPHDNDLFMMLNSNKYNDVIQDLEQRIEILIEGRHKFPMWPEFHDDPLDAYELEYHVPMRNMYYRTTIMLVRLLRRLRAVQ